MRIGILGGTGPAGSALAARLASVGYTCVIGSRSKYRSMEVRDKLVTKWPDIADRVESSDNPGAAECEIVVIATPWDSAATTAQEYAHLLDGKVVVSMANALVRVGGEFQPLVPPRGSVAAHVQAAVPRCHVVAAFHHLPASELGHLGEPIDSDVLICSDNAASTLVIAEIVGKIPGCRPLDAGQLSNATAIEAFTAVLLQLNIRYKTRVAPKLTGIKGDPRNHTTAPAPVPGGTSRDTVVEATVVPASLTPAPATVPSESREGTSS
jgi:NADPH-dependent F420 reductase